MGYEYKKIRPNIWQITEDEGVYCTLLLGKKMAILFDTGSGIHNIRTFVEQHVDTPYRVVNSHGHPDHCLGNHWFDKVYARAEEWDVIKYFYELAEGKKPNYQLDEITDGEEMDLGDLHVQAIALDGHTKGSLGLLVEEEQLLLCGDALNQQLWMNHYGAGSVKQFHDMLERIQELPFVHLLSGRASREMPKNIIQAHLQNLSHLKRKLIGRELYRSIYDGKEGKSVIVFEKRLLEESES